MLTYFPVPYEDELLYSCIARYALHTGQEHNQKAVVRDVFGVGTAVAIPDIPSHLQDLSLNVSRVWKTNVNQLIAERTLAPLYFPFLSERQVSQTISSMASKDGGKIHARMGLVASSVQPPMYFRFCPKCLEEQKRTLGECYWHRKHQLSGIDVCIEHNCKLENSNVYFHPKQKHHFHSASSECQPIAARIVDVSEDERRLIEFHNELLMNPVLQGFGVNRWSLFYQNLAKELGFMHKSRVQHQDVRFYLKQKWSNSLFKSYLDEDNSNDWITNIFRKHRKSFHPLRHLMVISVLMPESSLSDIFEYLARLPTECIESEKISVPTGVPVFQIELHRDEWRKLIEGNPAWGVKKIRTLSSGNRVYAWLYRNDRDWLISNSPREDKSTMRRKAVDYQDWDSKIVTTLEAIYAELVNSQDRPRLTQNYLIKKLSRASSIQKHLIDLPQTKQWLDSHAECLDDYIILRLDAAYRIIIEQNLDVKRWRLIRMANIRDELITNRIENEIQLLENKGK